MKFYDVQEKKYYLTQDANMTRIPFADGALKDAFEAAENGQYVEVQDLVLPEFIDKEVIRKNLLLCQLRYLQRTGDNDELAEEIKNTLYPASEDEDEEAENI